MGATVSYITIMLITQHTDIASVGIYSAAFALSGMFINFVLGAMSAEYYPLLTSAGNDKVAMNKLVNEQTEIGLLITAPGLMATMVLAPWIIQIFYTTEFLPAVELLQWFVLGCLGKMISWPLAFVMVALGKSRFFLLTETFFNLLHLLVILIGLYLFGVKGVAIAYGILYSLYVLAVHLLTSHLTGFSWSGPARRVVLISVVGLVISFAIMNICSLWPATIIGILSTVFMGLYSLRELVQRVNVSHRLAQILKSLPGFNPLLAAAKRLLGY
jgi:PST family polysaccharide transporter